MRWLVTVLALLAAGGAPAWGRGSDMAEHEGYTGFWLRTPALEAFVALEPVFRILSVKHPAFPTLLAGRSRSHHGIRLAFMEPDQIPESYEPGDRPAEVLERTGNSARVRLEPGAGLRYSVRIELEEKRSLLRLDYVLENTGHRRRRVACWSMASFERNGKMAVPFGEGSKSRRRLVLPWWTAWPQPGMTFGVDALLWDASSEYAGDAAKVGVVTVAGWCAYMRGEQALLSAASYFAGSPYPEDGANVALFVGPDHAETEQMSPLQNLAPGEGARHSETLEWVVVPPSVSREPDELRKYFTSRIANRPDSSENR